MNNRMLMIAEIAIMSALGIILGFIKLSGPWAFGGSVSLEIVPTFILTVVLLALLSKNSA